MCHSRTPPCLSTQNFVLGELHHVLTFVEHFFTKCTQITEFHSTTREISQVVTTLSLSITDNQIENEQQLKSCKSVEQQLDGVKDCLRVMEHHLEGVDTQLEGL